MTQTKFDRPDGFALKFRHEHQRQSWVFTAGIAGDLAASQGSNRATDRREGRRQAGSGPQLHPFLLPEGRGADTSGTGGVGEGSRAVQAQMVEASAANRAESEDAGVLWEDLTDTDGVLGLGDSMTKQQLDEIYGRLRMVESSQHGTTQPPPQPHENWPKRNAYWFIPTVAFVAGSGLIAMIAGSFVDGRLDTKLNGPTGSMTRIGAIETRIGATENGIARIESKLDTLNEFLKPLIQGRLRAAATLPLDQFKKELVQVKGTVALAREHQVKAPEEMKELGNRTIALAGTQSDISNLAWQAATEILNYRSILNVIPQEALAVVPLSGEYTWHYNNKLVPGKAAPQLKFTDQFGVSSARAARMDLIGEDKNGGLSQGPLFLIATGGAIDLDGMHIRNTVFQNVEIHYSGKPVILENITFVNCTFVIDNNTPGRHLGAEMLASGAVNFTNDA